MHVELSGNTFITSLVDGNQLRVFVVHQYDFFKSYVTVVLPKNAADKLDGEKDKQEHTG